MRFTASTCLRLFLVDLSSLRFLVSFLCSFLCFARFGELECFSTTEARCSVAGLSASMLTMELLFIQGALLLLIGSASQLQDSLRFGKAVRSSIQHDALFLTPR
jgi:uncharacterized membrane protein